MVLKLMKTHLSKSPDLLELCKLEIRKMQELRMELVAIQSLWDRYSDLLKAYDEVEQCKSTVTLEGVLDNLYEHNPLSNQQYFDRLFDIYSDNFRNCVGSSADNREATSSLNFYKNQVIEIFNAKKKGEGQISIRECAICQETLHCSPSPADNVERVLMLPCTHQFHEDCIQRWVSLHRKCPLCKKSVSPSQMSIVLPPKIQPTNRPLRPNRSRKYKVKGQWGTKVDALVEDVVELMSDSEREDEKIIVFSQWIEVLLINHFTFRNHLIYNLSNRCYRSSPKHYLLII